MMESFSFSYFIRVGLSTDRSVENDEDEEMKFLCNKIYIHHISLSGSEIRGSGVMG